MYDLLSFLYTVSFNLQISTLHYVFVIPDVFHFAVGYEVGLKSVGKTCCTIFHMGISVQA